MADHNHKSYVQETEELLREYSSAQSAWAGQAQDNMGFIYGAQFTEKQAKVLKARGQSDATINITFQLVNQAIAMLTANNPRWQAIAAEDSDHQRAGFADKLLEWMWHISRGNSEIKTALVHNYASDRGVLMCYFDPHADFGQGDILYKSVYMTEVYPDPNCRDKHWRDAANILIHRLLTEKQIFDTWGLTREEIGPPNQILGQSPTSTLRNAPVSQAIGPSLHSNPLDEKWSAIERFHRVRLPAFRVVLKPTVEIKIFNEQQFEEFLQEPVFEVTTSDGVEYAYEDDQIAEYRGVLATFGPVFHFVQAQNEISPDGEIVESQPEMAPGPENDQDNSIPGTTTQIREFAKAELEALGQMVVNRTRVWRIERGIVIGTRSFGPTVLPISDYPIKPIVSNHTGNPYSTADVGQVKGIQESLNKHNALIMAHAASSTSVKLLVPRGSVDKEEVERTLAKAGTGVIEFDAIEGHAPQIIQPLPLNNQLFQNMDRQVAFMRDILGLYPFQEGNTSNVPETYRGTLLMDEKSKNRISSKMNDVEETLSQLGAVALEWAQSVYTEEKVIRLIQPNGVVDSTTINEPQYDEINRRLISRSNDITIGRYDVRVIAGSTLPSSRMAQEEYMKELYTVGLIDQEAYLMKTQLFDAPKILERFGRMAQIEQQNAALLDQLKQTEGDLQTAQREVVHARQETTLAQFKTKLDKEAVETKGAVELFKRRLDDELKLTKQSRNE